MLVPVSNALMIQGPLVILGAVSTPATVALFSVTRTVARLGTAGSNMLSFALQPEYSFAFGQRDHGQYRRLLMIHAALLVAGLVAYGLCVVFLGQLGVRLISHGQLVFSTTLLWALGLATAFEMIWTALFTPLSAINAHKMVSGTLAAVLVIASVLVIPVAGVVNIAVALVVVHLIMTVVASWRLSVHKWPQNTPQSARAAATEPV
jgi:O-antigen/teichoic acid export membrane protein